MLALKYLLMVLGVALFGSAGALVAYDSYLSEQLHRLLSRGKSDKAVAEVGALARRPLRPLLGRTALQEGQGTVRLMASTAALSPFSQRLFPRQCVPCHPASGQKV